MPIEVEVNSRPVPAPLQYEDLQSGDVFTWGAGKFWYLKTRTGYVALCKDSWHIPDEQARGSSFSALRLGTAKVSIEE